MSSEYHPIEGSLDAQGKPDLIALLVASIVTLARACSLGSLKDWEWSSSEVLDDL
jgi:hypothetical protein